jgi:hypothetical protein
MIKVKICDFACAFVLALVLDVFKFIFLSMWSKHNKINLRVKKRSIKWTFIQGRFEFLTPLDWNVFVLGE